MGLTAWGKRIVLATVVVALATLFAGSALADGNDTQELLITPWTTTPGAVSDLDIETYVPQSAAPTENTTIDVPYGYHLAFPDPGSQIGVVDGTVAIGGTTSDVTGTLATADPATFASDPVSQACAPGQHAAAWVASFTANGQNLTIPVFLDPAPATDTTDSYVLQECFPSPAVPPVGGTTPLGVTVVDLDLETTQIFTMPTFTGWTVWRSFLTPYAPGTATADPQSTVEMRCEVPLPQHIQSLTVKYAKKPKHFPNVIIKGMLIAGGFARPGVHVRIDAGTSPLNLQPWAVATTNPLGSFTISKPLRKQLFAYFYVDPYFFAPCPGATSTAPKGCVREDISPENGPLRILKPKK